MEFTTLSKYFKEVKKKLGGGRLITVEFHKNPDCAIEICFREFNKDYDFVTPLNCLFNDFVEKHADYDSIRTITELVGEKPIFAHADSYSQASNCEYVRAFVTKENLAITENDVKYIISVPKSFHLKEILKKQIDNVKVFVEQDGVIIDAINN